VVSCTGSRLGARCRKLLVAGGLLLQGGCRSAATDNEAVPLWYAARTALPTPRMLCRMPCTALPTFANVACSNLQQGLPLSHTFGSLRCCCVASRTMSHVVPWRCAVL
jgi:hypothetical protein